MADEDNQNEEIVDGDTSTSGYGIPKRQRVLRRKYTMSPKAQRAREENAQKSTGPKTEEGKQASSRNAWKHGFYSDEKIMGFLDKPCLRTCSQYPCSLIEDEIVEVGERCLDKTYVANAFVAIRDALTNNNSSALNEMASMQLAGVMSVINEIQQAILEDGVLIKTPIVGKDGVILGAYRFEPHPLLAALPKYLKDAGITFTDFVLTPREIARKELGDKAGDVLNAATLMSSVLGRGKNSLPEGDED